MGANITCDKEDSLDNALKAQAHRLIVNVNEDINQTILWPKDQATIELVP